jgi:hypothetical protein
MQRSLERFPAKSLPVRVKKRVKQGIEPRFDSIGTRLWACKVAKG